MFGPQRWTKYFEIKSPLEDDFELYSRLAVEVGTDVLFRRQPDGVIIIEASSAEQSERLQMLVEADNPDLPIKKNQTLNTCYGTIIVPNNISIGSKTFAECGEKIKQNIKMQGCKIKDVTTFIRPPRGNRKYDLRIAKIAFDGRVLPDTVIIGGQRLSVREYVPAPRQCNKCWKYGHSIKYCKEDSYTCPVCGKKGHQKESCHENNKMCINCEGRHPAFSKSCMQYKRQQLIVKTQFKEGLSYNAAINKLKQTGEITPYNYKKALATKYPPTASTPKISELDTANKFSVLHVLQTEDTQISAQNNCPKSPKRSKRFRNHSSEEGGLSPELNPKQILKKDTKTMDWRQLK